MCNTTEHHFLLSSGQSTSKRFKAREAKYGKFAYSSAFGFSVPCGPFLEQIACDSTLAVSVDGRDETWRLRWDPYDVTTTTLVVGNEQVPTLVSMWRPWTGEEMTVKTILVPPVAKWSGWHIRIHQIIWQPRANSCPLRMIDGGFAASAQIANDASLFEEPVSELTEISELHQGWYKNKESALVISESGASGVADLTAHFVPGKGQEVTGGAQCEASVIRADPNTQVVTPL